MLLSPIAAAANSNWVGPSSVNPQGDEVTLTGFRVPGNATVLDGWLHVTDSPMAASLDSGIVWEGTDFSSGTFFGTELINDETLTLADDGTRSNITTFDEGDITVNLNGAYKYSPGWRHLYDYGYNTGMSGCSGGNGTSVERGWDNDFDTDLDSDEILWTDYFCDTVVNGTTIYWLFEFFSVSAGSNCEFAGNLMKAGLNLDGDNQLDSNEITNQTYFCHQAKLWGATTFTNLNGTIYGDEQTLPHGTVPSAATEGIVAVGTMPGDPVPAGTSGYFLIPQVDVPDPAEISGYYLTFDHWYHLDSTAAGGGDGAWVEYRINTNGWTDWSYIAPDGGYPSTMSTSAPTPAGAPTGAVPVFASPTHSGWVSSNISMSSISDIENASKIQFRFHIWTNPNAANERPGWFLDNIDFHNDGTQFGAWHGGCYTPGSPCTYSPSQYGALQRTMNLTGTNSTYEIEVDMEWDLQGSYGDNACVELSLNNNTWTDISSTSSSTSQNCEDRAGAIPGVSGYDGVSGDQSNGIRTVAFDIPTSFQNQGQVYIRFIVDSDQFTPHYGGNAPGDSQEGLTVDNIRVVDGSGNIFLEDDFETTTTGAYHYPAVFPNPSSNTQTGVDDWAHYIFTSGEQDIIKGFEDSTASNPSTNMPSGWTRNNNGGASWNYGQISGNTGPSDEPSFPYLMATNLNGAYGASANDILTGPTYSLPANSSASLVFDHWACCEAPWDGAYIQIKVNNGGWNHFDPGAGFYSHISTYGPFTGTNTPVFGQLKCTGAGATWTVTDTTFDHKVADLSQYAGDDVRFRYLVQADSIWQYSGWYLDNVGVSIANYGEPGDWLSTPFTASDIHDFNLGFIDIDAAIPPEASVRASLIDTYTQQTVPGYSNVSFPISLAGVDTTTTPQMRLRVHMDTTNEEETARISKIHIGGKRVLSATALEGNGWELSPSVALNETGILTATGVAGTISSDYLHSSRPIKSVGFSGNFSSGLTISLSGPNGGTLGTGSGAGIAFTYPQPGFGVSISLPTNGWIDRLVLTAFFAEPALNPDIDVLGDETHEWNFPFGDDYGHYGWQSLLSGMGNSVTATTLDLDGSNPASLSFRIPAAGAVNAGIISIAPDSDGFESPVSVSVGSATQTGSAGASPFHNMLDNAQILAINSLPGSHTDSDTGRQWREVSLSIDSSSAQTVTLTRMGVGYMIFENVSGLAASVSAYHDSQTQDDPPPVEVSIPVSISAEMGSVAIDGDLDIDYIMTNRDFQVPNTMYPDRQLVEIMTRHHHLYDNDEIEKITLRGTASDGVILEFEATKDPVAGWDPTVPVSFSQSSGSSSAMLDETSSYIGNEVHSDGWNDVVVHWMFDISWGWDDVDSIRWVAQAFDPSGETVWPAVSFSGQSGAKAVENDLQVDSFEIRDETGRLLSNQYSPFYPFPIIEGAQVNITGTVRFQDSTQTRPDSGDYSVGLNLSGNLFAMTSEGSGGYSGIVSPPASLTELSMSPMMLTVGPSGSATGAMDVTGVPPQVIVRIDSNPPTAGPLEINTNIGLQPAHSKVWEPENPLTLFINVDEGEARGEMITLRYWRESVDDLNMDGIADEDEYLSQQMPLTSGMTGQQQVQFPAVDVSTLPFNSMVHFYIEGTDWAGHTYQDGGTGGGPGAENAWASVVVATDEPTNLISSGYDLDREIGFLLAGVPHAFTLQIDELNGIHTLDNITVMLCGDGPSNLGKFTYDPSRGTLWSADDSMVSPLSAQSSQITSAITQISLGFELSWDYPWEEGQLGCKPSISIEDDLTTVAYQNNIGELTWELDNKFMAVPESMSDLTPPMIESTGDSLYLRQGDEFQMDGSIYYAGSQVLASEIPDDLKVEIEVIYGTQEIDMEVDVDPDGSFSGSMVLPARVPLNPEMPVTTSVLNVPGLGSSMSNSDASVIVDSKAPQALFNLADYPDSSLTILDSDRLADVTVTVTMVDEIGMMDGPLQVSWVYVRDNGPVAGTEVTGELTMIIDDATNDVYQSPLDLNPINGMKIESGDYLWFWITSTDKSGNEIIGSGSESAPRQVTLRIMEFLGHFTRSVINPSTTPVQGDILTIETFWENPGKREGEYMVGLYELVEGGQWRLSLSTERDGEVSLSLPAESSSVYANFQWESWQPGQPNLYLIVDGDFDNPYQAITGINVSPPPTTESGGEDSQMIILGGVLVVVVLGIAMTMMRGRESDDYYYEDDDEDYYEDDSWDSVGDKSEEEEEEEGQEEADEEVE